MAEPLKNIYNESFFKNFTQVLRELLSNFDSKAFLKDIYTSSWDQLALKARMRHIALTLNTYFPNDFEAAASILVEISRAFKSKDYKYGLEGMFLPDYIELYGMEHLKRAIPAFEEITKFTSCEFAVRPFIIRYPEQMYAKMIEWSKNENVHIRRLASEGCRPRLPWAMALPELKKDPNPILPILDNLKTDESEYVRRSVANNLNDIAKDNPDLVIDIAKKWIGSTVETDKLVKHACRTLLKAGHPDVMPIFGFGSVDNLEVFDLDIQNPKVKIGEYLSFSFSLKNSNDFDQNLRLEYAIYYQKANGTLSKKVYKISEKEYAKASTNLINRRQSFKRISTRRFHFGHHQLSVIVNGVEFDVVDFELVD